MSAKTQTYLIGPTIHLRAVEREDAASEPSWRESWFPRALAVSEAKIEDEHSGGDVTTLVALRNRDDVIVGSMAIWFDGAWAYARPFVARWLAPDSAEVVEAEMVELVVPFLVEEGGAVAALVEVASGKPLVEAALARIGAQFCYRQREAWQLDGERRDKLGYQVNNRKALETFSEPEITAEGPIDREVRSPAPKTWPVVETPPPGAVIVGERLYLRMFTPSDGEVMRDASLTDTEFSHDPRFPRSAMASNARFRKTSEADVPRNLTFVIVLRENDETIGRNELDFIDVVHRSAETGTGLFRPEHRGKGYGTEAKHLLLSYAFDVLNLHMVWSNVWEENPRSKAALLKQGYRLAGGIPWRGFHHGVPSGDWVFDLLASEWQAARR